MIIYLVRHGQDDDTVRGGWSNSSLTPYGIVQAESLAESIKANKENLSIGKIISSDLRRAEQTALIIANALELDMELFAEFREVNNGCLAGMKNELADKLYPDLYWRKLDWDQSYPNGESPKEFYERIYNAWFNLLKAYEAYDKNILLVTHAGVINVINSIVNNEQYSNKTKYQGVQSCKLDFAIETL